MSLTFCRPVLASLCLVVLAACGGGGDAAPAAPPANGSASLALSGSTSATFDSQQVGTTSAPRTFTVSSAGSAPVVVTNVTVSGAFAITGSTCTGSLAPSTTCSVTVTFTPVAGGRVSGNVAIVGNVSGGSFSIALDGTGVVSSGWVAGVFQPSRNFAALCAAPRSGTDPYTGRTYPDRLGSGVDERNWLRSWTNELYLWYSEVVDRDPGLYASTADYFDLLKVASKDRFHFTYKTSEWQALSTSGVSAGYGATFVLLSRTAPRKTLVAYIEPASPATAAGLARGAEILTIDGVDSVNATAQASVNVLNAGLFPATAGESHTFTSTLR